MAKEQILSNAKHYVGLSLIEAELMTRGDYNTFRGWVIPIDEDPADVGYITRNRLTQRVTWVPEEEFNKVYKDSNSKCFSFGLAVEYLKSGLKVSRSGWNGKGMYLYLEDVPAYDPYIVMHTAGGTKQPGWLASQADILAEDWQLLNG